jgi:magnesium-transporting ATPase (P-type)
MKILSHFRFRSLLAVIAAVSLTSIYPYLEMSRIMFPNHLAWVAMVSLFVCPFVVCWIAGRHLIIWGTVTNLILFSWLIVMVYVFGEGWFRLKSDVSPLAILCMFGLLSGDSVGSFVERLYKRLRYSKRAA